MVDLILSGAPIRAQLADALRRFTAPTPGAASSRATSGAGSSKKG
jgi:hypothetical protein